MQYRKQHITFFWGFTGALDWKSVWNAVKAREASDGFKSIFFVNIHCHCVSSVCRWAAKAGVLILCIVAAISIPIFFFKLTAIDKTVLSTATEVLLPRFEGLKPQQLFDRTWFILFYSFKNEWRRNPSVHLNLLWNLSLTVIGLRLSISLAKKS